MSAAAGMLGVSLEKVDYYTLGKEFASPDVNSIRAAVRVMWMVSAIWVFLLCMFFCIAAWSPA